MTRLILFLIVLASLIFSCQSSDTDESLKNGLVSWFPFGGNAHDKCSSRYDALVYGASPGINRFNIPNNSYSFNGINDYILIPHTFDTIPRTISFWFYAVDTNYGTGYGSVLQSDNPNLLCGNVGAALINVDDSMKLLVTVSAMTDTFSISPNKWANLTIVTNTDKSFKVYLNGHRKGKLSYVYYLSSVDGLEGIVLGANRTANTAFFKGSVDDLRFYNRALSEREISRIFSLTD